MTAPHRITRDEIPRSPSFCILPWIHVQLHQSGDVFPCCRMAERIRYGSLREKPFNEIWNDSPIRDLRKAFLKGAAPQVCSSCYRAEAAGLPSLRKTSLERFSEAYPRIDMTSDDGRLDREELLYLNLRFSNLCNHKCRICDVRNSTGWSRDAKAMGTHPGEHGVELTLADPQFWDWMDRQIPSLKRLYFAGGEPLLHRDHYLLLERLIARGRTDILLEYNTNFSKMGIGSWKICDLWSKFEEVHVSVSLDGTGSAGELLRSGLDSARLEKGFLLFRYLLGPKVRFGLYTTVGALNCFHLLDAIDRWLENGMVTGPGALEINLLELPADLSLAVLDSAECDRLREAYERWLAELPRRVKADLAQDLERSLRSVLAALPTSNPRPSERESFARFMRELDRLRGEDTAKHFPELKDLLSSVPDTQAIL